MELIGEAEFGVLFASQCSFVSELKSILAAVNFRQFRLKNSGLTLDVLINLIENVPHLDSLVLSSSPVIDPECLSSEDAKNYLTVAATNRITKLKISQSTSKEQLRCIFELFPRLEFLELDAPSGRNLCAMATMILNNQIQRSANLRSVCFNLPKADETLVERLKTTIDRQTLVRHFVVRRRLERIFLQWKFCTKAFENQR